MRVKFRLVIVLALTLCAGWLAVSQGLRLYRTITGTPEASAKGPGNRMPGGLSGGLSGGYRPPEAEVARTGLTRITPVIQAYGRIASRNQLTVRVPQTGIVAQVSDTLSDGTTVAAGDFLFQLDDTGARADLAIARADLARAELALRDARRQAEVLSADLELQQETRDIYEKELARVETLLQRGSGLQSDYDSARLSLISARQTIAATKAELADLKAGEDSLQLDIEDAQRVVTTAQRTLSDLTVTAGISGTYAGKLPVVGESLSSGAEPAIITDLTDLQARLNLSQLEIGRITGPGGGILPLPVTLRTPGSDRTYDARLSHVSLTESDDTVMSRQVIAVLDAASCPCPLPGEFVAATIHEPPFEDIAILPASALSHDGRVLVVGAGNVLEDQPVRLLRRMGETVVIEAPDTPVDYIVKRTSQLGAGLTIVPLRDMPAPPDVQTDQNNHTDAPGGAPAAGPTDLPEDAAGPRPSQSPRTALNAAGN